MVDFAHGQSDESTNKICYWGANGLKKLERRVHTVASMEQFDERTNRQGFLFDGQHKVVNNF
jgi:hypothetical protein